MTETAAVAGRALRPGRIARDLAAHSRRATTIPAGDVVLLDSGDPEMTTPAAVRDALRAAVDSGNTHYIEPFGLPALRERLAARESARSGAEVDASRVLVTHGASGGLGAALLAVLDPGDRVVIPQPTYSLYADQVVVAGAIPVFVPCTDDFHLDVDAIARAAEGARMVVICNPCNPTGAVYARAELEAVAAIAAEHDLLVLVDEAYSSLVFDGLPFTSALEVSGLAERTLLCETFSKTHAMTGWRLGWVVAPAALAPAIGKVHFTLHGPLNGAVQEAALAALDHETDDSDALLAHYAERRRALSEALADIPGVHAPPAEGTFYCFLRYPQDVDAVTMAGRCIEHGVAVRAGSEFGDGGEGHLRISTTASEADFTEGLRRLRAALLAP